VSAEIIGALGLAAASAPVWVTLGGVVLIGAGVAATTQVISNLLKDKIYKSKGIKFNE
jgi:hypothetical protein